MRAISQHPWGEELLVAREFNTYLASQEGQECDKTILAEMAAEGLEDIV